MPVTLAGFSIPLTTYCFEVQDQDNNPVSGATVTITGDPTVYTTDSAGKAYVGVLSGTVNVSKSGFSGVSQAFDFTGLGLGECIVIQLAPEPYISPEPENINSYLYWFTANGLSIQSDQLGYNSGGFIPFNDWCNTGDEQDFSFPNKYLRNKDIYYPKLIVGESINVILNFYPFPSLDNYRLCLLDAFGAVVQDDMTYNTLTTAGGDISIYINDIIEVGDDLQEYRFCFYQDGTQTVFFISNPFEVVTDKECFVNLQYRNSCSIDGYDYDEWPGVYNSYYIDFNQKDVQYENEIENYRAQSTQKLRTQKSNRSKYADFETFYFDEKAHDATNSMLNHDDILFNSQQMELKEGVIISNEEDKNNVSKGRFKLYIQKFSTINFYGSNG